MGELKALEGRSMRRMLGWTCLVLLPLAAIRPIVAADPATLVIPRITKPLVEPAENDPLQADYDKMWNEYEGTVQKATVAIKEALDKQIAKATDSGELDLVEMWERLKKRFDEQGRLDWDTGSKASVEWKKTNPKVPYPREFNDAVRTASDLAESAKEKLEEGYADLVKAYTKAKNVPRAKELRDEGVAAVSGKLTNAPQVTAGVSADGPQAKPQASGSEQGHSRTPAKTASLADRLKGTKWTNSNNATFQWEPDGRLLHNNTERQWRVLDETSVEVVFGASHKDVLIFDAPLASFTQRIYGGPKTFEGRRDAGANALQPLATTNGQHPVVGEWYFPPWKETYTFRSDGRFESQWKDSESKGRGQWKTQEDGSVVVTRPTGQRHVAKFLTPTECRMTIFNSDNKEVAAGLMTRVK